jgi:hypothetical protein
MPDDSYIPEADKLAWDRLCGGPPPMRLEQKDGARYPGFCPAPVPEEETDAPAPIDDSEMSWERFERLSEIPPSQRRRDGGI